MKNREIIDEIWSDVDHLLRIKIWRGYMNIIQTDYAIVVFDKASGDITNIISSLSSDILWEIENHNTAGKLMKLNRTEIYAQIGRTHEMS